MRQAGVLCLQLVPLLRAGGEFLHFTNLPQQPFALAQGGFLQRARLGQRVLGAAPLCPGLAQGADSYWWGGAFGTWFWIDPTNDIVFVGMIQNVRGSVPGGGTPDVRTISPKAVYAALAGKTTVDAALKASQVSADREMKKAGYYK